ncbi:MAG: RimK family alpha-L-glutamate ligase [Mobilitalea sp.]
MKKALILVNAFSRLESHKHQPKRLKEELNKLGVEVDIRPTSMNTAMIKGGDVVAFVKDYDFVIYLDKDKYSSALLEQTGIRIFNRHEAIVICDDKMETHIRLANQGIPMPDTIPGLLCYYQDAPLELALERMVLVEQKLGYPCVIKECYGSLGTGVHKVSNREELLLCMEQVKCKEHLFQKMIGNGRGRDVRVIVIGGKAVACMMRTSETDFRSNIELGGKAVPYELPKNFQNLAEKVANILKLDYCGIDLLIEETGEPVICEVNSNAFFGAMEATTGVNVAGLYAKYLYEAAYS